MTSREYHRCHAEGCNIIIPPSMLMCWPHWQQVPQALKNAVWRYYRRGQEVDKQPSQDYLAAAQAAIDAVKG